MLSNIIMKFFIGYKAFVSLCTTFPYLELLLSKINPVCSNIFYDVRHGVICYCFTITLVNFVLVVLKPFEKLDIRRGVGEGIV